MSDKETTNVPEDEDLIDPNQLADEPAPELVSDTVESAGQQVVDDEPQVLDTPKEDPSPDTDTIPADENEPDDDEVGEIFGGEYVGHPNVKEEMKVVDELTDDQLKALAKNGSVLLSNHTVSELSLIRDAIQIQIQAKQQHRRSLAEKGQADGYYAIESQLPSGEPVVIYVTDQERIALSVISDYEASLRTSAEEDLFEDDEWTNRPVYGDVKIIPGRLDHSKSKDPIVRIQGKLGLASSFSNPFWGSGVHLVIEGGGALDELSLNERILQEKSESGRLSSGYIYSAGALYLIRPTVDYILGNVKSSTAGTVEVEDLKQLMLVTDIEPLALAQASAMHPDGYLLERPCLTTAGGCGNIERGLINIRKMLFVRRSRINDNQLQFMIKRSGQVDTSRIREYQRSLRPEVTRLIKLEEGLFIRMRIPTIAEYERLADGWIQTMDARARAVARSGANQNQRQAYMLKAQSVAVVMAYGHWFDAVLESSEDEPEPKETIARYYGDDSEKRYEADQAMDRMLESFAKKPELTEKITEGLRKFIKEMTLATAAVPKVICSKCGKPVTGDSSSDHPHLVNVNPLELFFTLLHQQIQRHV